jgi:TRAP-type C4-dicarboxylate transport system permease small subunit
MANPEHGDSTPVYRTLIPFRFERVAMALAMGAIAVITAANVVTRYLTNISLAFTEEFSVVLMVIATLLGTASAIVTGRHIKIAYFADLLPERGQRLAEMIGLALLVLCFGVVLVYGTWLTWDEYRFEVLSPGMELPQWLLTGCLPLVSLFVVWRAVERILVLARGRLP